MRSAHCLGWSFENNPSSSSSIVLLSVTTYKVVVNKIKRLNKIQDTSRNKEHYYFTEIKNSLHTRVRALCSRLLYLEPGIGTTVLLATLVPYLYCESPPNEHYSTTTRHARYTVRMIHTVSSTVVLSVTNTNGQDGIR